MTVTLPSKTPTRAQIQTLADVRPMIERLKTVFGVRGTAQLIGVDPGNLTKYLHGTRPLNAQSARRAIDLDHVLTRAAQVFVGRTILKWFTSYSVALGARPIDVFATAGAAPLLDDLERIATGAYA